MYRSRAGILQRFEVDNVQLSHSLVLIPGASKIHFRRCLPVIHSQKQKQKDNIRLAYLAPLYF